MSEAPNLVIAQVLLRAPNWMKNELISKDQQLQVRAAEALSAVISTALAEAARAAGQQAE